MGIQIFHSTERMIVGLTPLHMAKESDRLGFTGYQTYAVGELNVVSERLFIQPCCGGTGCIYQGQVCLPIGFAWLCERW